ncbi:MAG: cell division protein FtsK [Chloroflexi bacterium]|uniref:Cell division protein FtsK n=1 Tax=Candidatus Chlorohelix allophototropha TaxID=3003348 RepID=A0A8T7M505_9CHLR|nr:cell division protein FtsK [Chloroflexota bacterium]WJW69061.1 hypothetical protein OZ401_002654 [Chloroflexota bacterium L227-S17]
MSEPALLARQRALLKNGYVNPVASLNNERSQAQTRLKQAKDNADLNYKQAQEAAEKQLKQDEAYAEQALKQVEQQAAGLLGMVQQQYNRAPSILQPALNKIKPQNTYPRSNSDPHREIEKCRQIAEEVANKKFAGKKANSCLTTILALLILGGFFGLPFGIGILTRPPQNYYSYRQDFNVPVVVAAFVVEVILLVVWGIVSSGTNKLEYRKLVQALADAKYWHKIMSDQNQNTYNNKLAGFKTDHQYRLNSAKTAYQNQQAAAQEQNTRELDKAERSFREHVARACPAIDDFSNQINVLSPAWNSSVWNSWNASQKIPEVVSLGMFRIGEPQLNLTTPALIPFTGNRTLVFKATGTAKTKAVQSIQSLLLRLLASTQPGKLLFTFLDPVGLGQNVAPLIRLSDYDPKLVNGKAWTEPQHLEQRLADLSEHMENVIQKYLSNQYKNIEEYNTIASVIEPYRLLVVFDFPANFSEAAARRLVSIAQNGPRCGVYTVVVVDPGKPMPHGFTLSDLEQSATVIEWNGKHFVMQDNDFKEFPLELDNPPSNALFDQITKTVGEKAQTASKVVVPFENICPPFQEWWQDKKYEIFNAALGPADSKKSQQLEFGGSGTAHHALVVGRTGSGKSSLLHTLITSVALKYSPEEVQLYLIDFKKGVEFKIYAKHQLPHARVIAIQSEREFGLSVLQGLDTQMQWRGDTFRDSGVQNLPQYRKLTGKAMPRILLIADEFQEFFTEDDQISSRAAQIIDRLVKQGRSAGIHLVLCTQTLTGSYTLPRSTIDQMGVRVALQCSEADSRLILADDNPAARLLSRSGEAIYNAENGRVEGNKNFQVAFLSSEKQAQYLEQIFEKAKKENLLGAQLVFEGDQPAEVEKNRQLQQLLSATAYAPKGRTVSGWLGEPIAIKDSVAANFRRQSGSNLLIVSKNEELALGMFMTNMVSLAAQLSPVGSDYFYLLNFGTVDSPYSDQFDQLKALLPHSLKLGKRSQLQGMLSVLAAEVKRRSAVEGAPGPDKFLAVFGLHRANEIRQDDSGFGSYGGYGNEESKESSPIQNFTTILKEGPEVGIHTLVWCDNWNNLNRSLDRRVLREFGMRVAMQMSAEDSSNLLDSPVASKLGSHRAYLFDEEDGRLEKFRPYNIPAAAWLKQVSDNLNRKV